MIDDDDMPDAYHSYKFTLNFTRIILDHIVSSNLKIRIDYVTNSSSTPEDIMTAWNKIEIWLDNLNQSVAISAGNPLAVATMISGDTHTSRFSNTLLILPGEPTEELFGYILQAKLNALASDVLAFGIVDLQAEEAAGITVAITGHHEDNLPTMKEWIDGPNWFTEPWWNRDDGSTIDSEPPAGCDLTVMPPWEFPWDFLAKKNKPSGVVISGRFKPKLVDKNSDE